MVQDSRLQQRKYAARCLDTVSKSQVCFLESIDTAPETPIVFLDHVGSVAGLDVPYYDDKASTLLMPDDE